MSAQLRVWQCSYSWSGGWGAFQDYEVVVVAEIESKAIGMAVQEFKETDPKLWKAFEIPTDKEGVHFISERSS